MLYSIAEYRDRSTLDWNGMGCGGEGGGGGGGRDDHAYIHHFRSPPCDDGDAGPLPRRISAFTTGLQSYTGTAFGRRPRYPSAAACKK